MPHIVLLHGVQSSRTTWWQVGQDLADLGWQVSAPNLPGHGARAGTSTSAGLAGLADDVDRQLPAGADLIVGHSLGALVALTLVTSRPDRARLVVVEDPPGLGGGAVDSRTVADDVQASVARARRDGPAAVAQLLATNPLWSRVDAEHAVASRQALDVERVTGFLRSTRWDLPALVAGCPRPVLLLAARADASALRDPDRAALIRQLGDRARVVDSGHSIHRDRPALWLQHVLGFAARSAAGD